MLIALLVSGLSIAEGGRIPPWRHRVSKSRILCAAAYVGHFNLWILFILREERLGGLEMHQPHTRNG